MSLCKCGKKIAWGEKPDGGKVPLDPSAPVYSLIERTKQDGTKYTEVVRTTLHMVSHFATCKFANDFSGSKKV